MRKEGKTMLHRALKLPLLPPHKAHCSVPLTGFGYARKVVHTASLTLALSLPQGLLALPIAFAQVGVFQGVLILLLIGLLNTVTVVYVAQAVATYFALHGVVPSLPQLARSHLGRWGGVLTCVSGGALFFLALMASLVGLARSFADLTGTSAPLWGGGCVLITVLVLRRAALNTRLLIGLGLLNIGLLVVLLIILLPGVQVMTVPVAPEGTPIVLVGVSLMLFFAPMLLPSIALHLLPRGYASSTLVYGSGVGVAGGTLLFVLWAIAVYSVAGGSSLADASGTVLPALLIAMPATKLPGLLLGLLLLGMTALRCALVLSSLAEEQLSRRLGKRSRHLTAQLPAGLAMTIVLLLLFTEATSFTQLIAIAGGGAASLTSLVIPALLAHRGRFGRRHSTALPAVHTQVDARR
jgi:amino acid permease